MGQWTNNGLALVATAIQTPGAQVAMTYVGISTGCGTLATGLTSGVAAANLSINSPGLPANLPGGSQITITDGVNKDTATVAGGGALAGATSIPLTGYTPAFTFAPNTTAVAPTPLASDTTLYGESQRTAISGASAGASPGESLMAGYFDGTQPTGVFVMVGYFGDPTATGTIGTGTLMGEDIVYWNHVQYNETQMYQADSLV